MSENKLICHISFNHSPFDDRIYWKELLSLKQAGYNCVHIAVGERTQDFISKEGIRIIIIKRQRPFMLFRRNAFISKVLQALFKKRGTISNILKVAASLSASIYHYHDLQINAISKDLKNLSHHPILIYDAHEAYHLMIKEIKSTNLFGAILEKAASVVIPKWEILNAAFCDYIISTDNYTFEYFRKKLPNIPGSIVHNYSFFSGCEEQKGNKEFDFIYSGMLSATRGIREIIYAFKHCKEFFSDCKLLLIGGFDEESFEAEILSLIRKLNLENDIIIKSWVPFSEMARYYSLCRIGLCLLYDTPKYSTAIAIKLFEYMAFGLPVIFSNHGPSAEIIKEKHCGILVPYYDSDAVVDAMKELLSNQKLVTEFDKNGRQAVINFYNWQKEKDKLLIIYQRFSY